MSEADFYKYILYGFFLLAPLTAGALLFVSAPYGRHARGGWGPMVSPRLGWILMEAPSPLGMLLCFFLGAHRGAGAIALLLLWQLHYIHRAFIFPFRLRNGRPMPLSVALMGLSFNLANSYLNGRWLFTLGPELGAGWLLDPRFLLGAALFLAGFAVNLHADTVLLGLRRPGETGYKVPRGGLYRFISCPNYFGEIVEWCGFALASWSPAGLAFALWTAANLGPRARSHHQFYRDRVPGYPTERRALLPFLW